MTMHTVFLAPSRAVAEIAAREMGIIGKEWMQSIVVTSDADVKAIYGLNDYRVIEVLFARGITRGLAPEVRTAVRNEAARRRVAWIEHWLA